MKLSVLLVVFGFFALQAKPAYSQEKISLNLKEVTVERVLDEIESQTDFRFIYKVEDVDIDRQLSIVANRKPVDQILNQVFGNTKTSFTIENSAIYLLKQPDKENVNQQDPIRVNGTVSDQEGTTMSGVTVLVKGTRRGASTDFDGNYAITVPDRNAVLVFSSIGFAAQEIVVGNRTTINVVMKESVSQLDEVVLSGGYYNVKQREATGSISKISAEEIEKQPVNNPLQALQGKVPGLIITQESGLPGAGIKVNIRGVNSLAGSTTPLYIINGVPFTNVPVANNTGSNISMNPATNHFSSGENPLNYINPSDIESIEVLKDADATAMYGSRAANGVVLITTKKGKAGKTTFSVNSRGGISQVANKISVLNTTDYIALREQALEANGITPDASNAPDLMVWDPTTNQNFQKKLFGNTAVNKNTSLSLSGGNELVNFLVSGTYDEQGTVFSNEFNSKKLSLNINQGYTSLNGKFDTQIAVIYSNIKNNLPVADYFPFVYTLPPNYPLYTEEGDINYTVASAGINNPLSYNHTSYESVTNNLVSNLRLQYRPLPGLTLKTSIGYTKADNQTNRKAYSKSIDPAISWSTPNVQLSQNVTESIIIEPQATYQRTLGKGELNILAGASWQSNDNRNPYSIRAIDYTSDLFLDDLAAAGSYTLRSSSNEYRYQSVFGRVNYNYNSNYILNANFRRDGSSLFGPKNRYGNFWSVGGAWIFSEESLIKDNLSWFNYGKLRGSYGLTGNDNASAYAYLPLYTTTSNYGGQSALVPLQIHNPNYRWEKINKLEVALEAGLFDNRLLFSAAWYRNRSDNQLVQFPISGQTGFNSYQNNLSALIENSGYEFTVNTQNIQTENFSWNTSLNFGTVKNKLLEFDNIENSPYANTYVVGHSLTTNYVYQQDGIDPDTKLPAVTDVNQDGMILAALSYNNAGGDYLAYGDSAPDITGGFSNSFNYKGLTLEAYFRFESGAKKPGISSNVSSLPGGINNISSVQLENLRTLYSSAGEDFSNILIPSIFGNFPGYIAYNNYTTSNAVLEDASFVRLQNVSLSYDIPKKVIDHLGIQNFKVYAQGQNLLTITDFSGLDPESGALIHPPLRTIAMGVNIIF